MEGFELDVVHGGVLVEAALEGTRDGVLTGGESAGVRIWSTEGVWGMDSELDSSFGPSKGG